MSFGTIKLMYEVGLWNKENLLSLVKSGQLTDAQYTEITGQAIQASPATPQTSAQYDPTKSLLG